MAIVKMKRLRLIALRADREELLKRLQDLGCVEIDEPQNTGDDPAWVSLARPSDQALGEAKERQSRVAEALEALQQYAPEKGSGLSPRPEVSRIQFLDRKTYDRALTDAAALCGARRDIAALESEFGKLQAQRASLGPWLGLEVPLETGSTPSVTALFGTLPVVEEAEALLGELGPAGELCSFTVAGRDRNFQYLFFLCHQSVAAEAVELLQAHGFSRTTFRGLTGTAAENDRRIRGELEANQKEREALAEKAAGYAGERAALRLCADRTTQDVRRETAKAQLRDTGETFFLAGWFPAEDQGELKVLLDSYPCAWESADPAPEEYPQVPVKLKNNWLTRPLNMVTEMYSLPAYDGVDPNPLMAPFFILFYGIMLADMGYGLLMILASLIVTKRLKPKGTMDHLFRLMGLCGVSTFAVGALTGGFFGDFIPQLAKLINPNTTLAALPSLFTPLDDTLSILVGAMCLGFVQIVTGMAISFVEKLKRGEVMDAIWEEVTWWVVFLGAALAILGVTKIILIVGGVMILIGSGWNAKGFGKVTAVIGSLYNHITGYFGDILSYSRLMALMLAGSVIAQVFNTLGAIPGNIVLFLIISFAGNALNFALNLLGCYVHDLRLQCLEYFNKFYKDGGKPFRPLDIETKYIDVVQE